MTLAVEDSNEAALREGPFVKRIEQATGIPVRFFTGTSYSSVVEAMRAKRIDGMQMGVFSYLLAEKVAGAEAIAVYVTSYADPAVYDPRWRPDYNGIIVVKKGNGIRSLADLKGRTLLFGDPAGTSDHLVPQTELIKAGLVPDKDVKTRFAGNLAAALLALWNGKADAAASADTALRHYGQSGQIEYCGFPDRELGRPHSQAEIQAVFDACPDGKLVAIHSAPIPGTPFALRGDLPADLKQTIRASLLGTPRDPEFIRAAKRWYVDPSIELKLPNLFAYYDSMREMAKLLDLDLRKLK
jgi:phosphonate transport system substrate-binding protein